jgi:hypothetical protein
MTASEVCCAANNLISTYKFDLCSEFETPEDYAIDLTQDVLSYRFCSKEELLGMTNYNNWKKLKSGIDIFKHLQIDELITSYSKLVSISNCFGLLPVTVATAESLSKLKIIKTYLRPPIAQDSLDALSLISIKAGEARKLSVHRIIDSDLMYLRARFNISKPMIKRSSHTVTRHMSGEYISVSDDKRIFQT